MSKRIVGFIIGLLLGWAAGVVLAYTLWYGG